MNRTPLSKDTATNNNLSARHHTSNLWQALFFFSTIIGIIALATLLATIFNQAFGYVILENKVDPATLADQPLNELSEADLIAILQANISRNRLNILEAEEPLAERSQGELLDLVLERIVEQRVVESYHLDESLLTRAEIFARAETKYTNATVEFKSWLSLDFIRSTMSRVPEAAGVRTALLGSLMLIAITILVAFPIGLGAAIYLEEYADPKFWINRIIQTNIENLAGVPSIIYGILGLAIFVRAFAPITSGELFGISGMNGRTILSASMTMALLILPIVIINAQEAIRAVPRSIREASYGLGGTQWQTIWNHVLPIALPGIMTGTILAISRAMGETAPLIVVGASTYLTSDPNGPFSAFTALPIQIYNWTARPQDAYRNIAAAAIVVLLISLLSLNAFAILLRNRFRRQ
jgi:phosphate transport system permease protein